MHERDDPRPVIRAVLLAGFFSGNLCGVVYMVARGVFVEGLRLNPLAMLGGFLGVGLLGMMGGALCGLSLRLVLERTGRLASGRWTPVVIAALASGFVGLVIVYALVGILWDL
jgi:hypothetical protein